MSEQIKGQAMTKDTALIRGGNSPSSGAASVVQGAVEPWEGADDRPERYTLEPADIERLISLLDRADFNAGCVEDDLNDAVVGRGFMDERYRFGRLLNLYTTSPRALPPSPPEGQGDGWQPIETAPKDGVEVIVCGAPGGLSRVAFWDHHVEDWRVWPGREPYYGGRITHWMPLPKPPTPPRALPDQTGQAQDPKIPSSKPYTGAGEVERDKLIEQTDWAERCLEHFCDKAHAGQIEWNPRAMCRTVWGAFTAFREAMGLPEFQRREVDAAIPLRVALTPAPNPPAGEGERHG